MTSCVVVAGATCVQDLSRDVLRLGCPRDRPAGRRYGDEGIMGRVFIRFQSPVLGRRGVHPGVFGLANTLAKRDELSPEEYAVWRSGNDWFDAAYPDPSKADQWVYDEVVNPLATAWFKESATHLLARVPPYLAVLAAHEVECVRVEDPDPGRIIYADDVQIVVVPHDPPLPKQESPPNR